MGFQFVHIETFSRKADKQGRSVAFILQEARREPTACQHVPHPLPPTVIHGISPVDVEALHDRLVADAATVDKSGKTRRLRVDQHTLCTVVSSHPATMDMVRADGATAAAVADWERRTLAWLVGQYGDRLVSVVRHEDESHPHVHAYVLPRDDPTLRAKALHPGWAAKDAAIRDARVVGTDAKTANARGDTAYKKAMRQWQESYWQSVGLPCGLARLGPGRRRLTRAAWQAEQSVARTTGMAIRAAEQAKHEARQTNAEARERVVVADVREAEARAAADHAHAAIADAKRRLGDAKRVEAEANQARRRVEGDARQKARAVLAQAKTEGARILAEAEARAAPLRRVGGWLGTIWTGFRGVEARLTAAADARVAKARTAAASEVSRAKVALRQEAETAVGAELASLRRSAEAAQRSRAAAEKRAEKAEAEARRLLEVAQSWADAERKARGDLHHEQQERKRFQAMWAEADNRLLDLDQRNFRPR